jgi:copper chaperone CopZ
MNVKKSLDALDGVSESVVEVGSAMVTFDEARVNRDDLEAAIRKAGYQVSA